MRPDLPDPADHVGRKFFNAIRMGDLHQGADYLSIMVQTHLAGDPDNNQTLAVFLSSHLISAFDLSGNMELYRLAPMEDIIRTEIAHFRADYPDHPNAADLLVHHIMRQISECCGLDPTHSAGKMEGICRYVQENYADPNLSVNDLSEKFDLSVSYLSRTFKRIVGVKLIDYIHSVRIHHAQKLLQSTQLPISDIADQLGFTSSSAFIRTYRSIEGITPGAYRDQVTLKTKNKQV